MRPSGVGSVMAAHAPQLVEADDPLTALYRRLNYFPIPPWAARAGGELIGRFDPGRHWAWEPCCGEGHMAGPLADYFARILATDVHDYGSIYQNGAPLDFLSADADDVDEADWIVANPPFNLAAEFVEVALRRARRGVAIFNRATWFESGRRHGLFCGDAPVSLKATFFERVPLHLGRWEPEGDTATAYAWFIWLKPQIQPEWLRELRRAVPDAIPDFPIPPGTRRRLTLGDDVARYGSNSNRPRLAA